MFLDATYIIIPQRYIYEIVAKKVVSQENICFVKISQNVLVLVSNFLYVYFWHIIFDLVQAPLKWRSWIIYVWKQCNILFVKGSFGIYLLSTINSKDLLARQGSVLWKKYRLALMLLSYANHREQKLFLRPLISSKIHEVLVSSK